MGSCSHCGKPQVFARGYCQGCYSRLRRRGTLDRANVVNSGKCMVGGCDREAFSKNLCSFHYSKNKHPIWNIWKLLRSRNSGRVAERWNLFENFLADVGERPSDRHRLVLRDLAGDYHKDNVCWVEAVHREPPNSSMTRAERTAYNRAYHNARKFKLTPDQFQTMRDEHNDLCGICGDPETTLGRTGGKRELSVDHDHKTGAVRGLLCNQCNAIIGKRGADDSIPRLRAAIAYLEKHTAK